MPIPLASAATARTMLSELEFSVMFLTKERSILILSNGKLCKYVSDEYPVPKSSIAIRMPSARN